MCIRAKELLNHHALNSFCLCVVVCVVVFISRITTKLILMTRIRL